MRLTHFFIDRPRFATVLSIFVTAFGLGALAILPVAQYPEIDGHISDRHRPQRRANADAKPGAGRAGAPARRRAAPGRAGPQGDTEHPIGRSPLFAG